MSKYKYSRKQLVEMIDRISKDWRMAETFRKSGIDPRGIDLTTPFEYMKQCCIECKES